MQVRQQVRTIDLLELLSVYTRRLWIIILSAIVGGAAVFAYTYFFITPLYKAYSLFYVNNSNVSIGSTNVTFSAGELSAAKTLVDTYLVVLTSIPTVDEVIEESGVDYSYEQVVSMISASAVNDTEIFRVIVTSPDPAEAQLLANTIADVLPGAISDVVNGSDVRVVQRARFPMRRSSPSFSSNTTKGALAGAAIAILILTLGYYLDETIRSEEYLTSCYPKLPLLGVIPDVNDAAKGGYGRYYRSYSRSSKKNKKELQVQSSEGGEVAEMMLGPAMSFSVSEAYKLLRTSVSFAYSGEGECHVIGVTSSFRNEGKTTVSINTAYTIAETGKRVLLIDADMRLSDMARRLGLGSRPGLSDLLADMNSVREAIQQYSALMEDGHTVSMDVLIAGSVPPNPAELLESERMHRLMERLRERYDFIVLDLPPVTEVADALIVSRVTDGMMLIVRHNVAVRGSVAEMIRQIELVDGRISGFVYNAASESGSGYYKRYGYRHGYYYRGYYRQGSKADK